MRRNHYGNSKQVPIRIVLPFIIAVVFFNGLSNAFHAKAVETGSGFCGNQVVARLFWGRITAVADDDDAVTVAVYSGQRNRFFNRLLRSGDRIVQQVTKDRHQIHVLQLGKVANLDVVFKGDPPASCSQCRICTA